MTHDDDLFCQCAKCRRLREAAKLDPMESSCAALEGPGPYLPSAVATMLDLDYLLFIEELFAHGLLEKRPFGYPVPNPELIAQGILEERQSLDYYGFKRSQTLITRKGVQYLADILGIKKEGSDAN